MMTSLVKLGLDGCPTLFPTPLAGFVKTLLAAQVTSALNAGARCVGDVRNLLVKRHLSRYVRRRTLA